MSIFILEGYRDMLFIQNILEFHFKIDNMLCIWDKDTFKRGSDKKLRVRLSGMKKLAEILTNKNHYKYIKKEFRFIVYGDNGKQTVIHHVLPELCYLTLGKIREELKFLVILDEDGTSLQETITNIFGKLYDNKPQDSVVTYHNNKEIQVVSTVNSVFTITIRVFVIPKNLETQLVEKAIKRLNKDIPKNKLKKLRDNDSHESLNEIASLVGIDERELVKKSIYEGWFINERWYKYILNDIREFFELRDPVGS